MIPTPQIAALFLASYLLGAVPFGLIVSRLKGVDIRRHGSGNPGATNVGRTLGRNWGLLVFGLDLAKGAATSIGARLFAEAAATGLEAVHRDWLWLGTGLCCVVGNIAPVYLRFRGGKGVATALGVILGIFPFLTVPAAFAFLVWAIVVGTTRYVSLGSIIAALTLPAAFLLCARLRDWPLRQHYPLLLLTILLAVVVVVRHRRNIGRLFAGTESKVGAGPT